MKVHESVRRCSECEEVTPHSRRVVAVPRVLGGAALIGAGLCFLQGVWFLGGLILVLTVFLFLHDREKFWAIHCERCRGRKLRELQRTKPTLDGNTEINIL